MAERRAVCKHRNSKKKDHRPRLTPGLRVLWVLFPKFLKSWHRRADRHGRACCGTDVPIELRWGFWGGQRVMDTIMNSRQATIGSIRRPTLDCPVTKLAVDTVRNTIDLPLPVTIRIAEQIHLPLAFDQPLARNTDQPHRLKMLSPFVEQSSCRLPQFESDIRWFTQGHRSTDRLKVTKSNLERDRMGL